MNEEINEGDLVVCVESFEGNTAVPPLTKGSKYVCNGVDKCRKCGNTYINIGFSFLRPPINPTCTCGAPPILPLSPRYEIAFFRKLPPPAKEIRIVEISSDLREEVRELVNDVLVKERRDV